jgi:hypothetical protein
VNLAPLLIVTEYSVLMTRAKEKENTIKAFKEEINGLSAIKK